MSNDEIDAVLREFGVTSARQTTGGDGARWDFGLAGAPAYIQTQGNVDRMRIVATIGNPRERKSASLGDFMAANFHTALDARYALSDGMLVAAFLHPLKALGKMELAEGLRQVSLCVRTAGRENASSPLTYDRPSWGGGKLEEYEDPKVGAEPPVAPNPYRDPPWGRQLIQGIATAVVSAFVGALVAFALGG